MLSLKFGKDFDAGELVWHASNMHSLVQQEGLAKAKSPLVRAGFRLPFVEENTFAPPRHLEHDNAMSFNRSRNSVCKGYYEDVGVDSLLYPYLHLKPRPKLSTPQTASPPKRDKAAMADDGLRKDMCTSS
jgi:hypothetical protein